MIENNLLLKNIYKVLRPKEGFTLVEMMVALVVASFIMAAVFGAYVSNQKVHSVQNQVVDMQQNLRASSNILERELRMAGFDPGDAAAPVAPVPGVAGATILSAFPNAVSFSFDSDEDGCLGDACPGGAPYANEFIAFYIDNAGLGLRRAISDEEMTIAEPTAGSGQYEVTANALQDQPIARTIEAIEFFYTIDDGTGTITKTTEPTAAEYDDIVSVQISILARAEARDMKFNNGTTYRPASALPSSASPTAWNDSLNGQNNPPNDNFRRRLSIHTIKLRNMGL